MINGNAQHGVIARGVWGGGQRNRIDKLYVVKGMVDTTCDQIGLLKRIDGLRR